MLAGACIVRVSDNECAVAMATHLYSPTDSIRAVVRELRVTLLGVSAQSAGFNLPGVLNDYADAPSRAAKGLYVSFTVSEAFCAWVHSLKDLANKSVVTVVWVKWAGTNDVPRLAGNIVWFVPPPPTREALLDDALRRATAGSSDGNGINSSTDGVTLG